MLFSDKFRFKWTQTSSEINYLKLKEGQHIVNHISNSKIFTNKISTLDTLQNIKFMLQNGDIKSEIKSLDSFFPETYRLDVVADLVKFLNSTTEGLWLVKKAQSNQGKGIKLISDIKAYKDELLTIKDQAQPDSTQLLIEKLKLLGIEEEPAAEDEQKEDNEVA